MLCCKYKNILGHTYQGKKEHIYGIIFLIQHTMKKSPEIDWGCVNPVDWGICSGFACAEKNKEYFILLSGCPST